MTLVITMLILSSVFMFVMAHSLIQGHNSIAFEFSLKSKLSNLYAQSEDEQIDKYGKAHCIVMGLAEALENEDKKIQFRQTQVLFKQVEQYKVVAQRAPFKVIAQSQIKTLKLVK